ncbi:AraC family transcriptional regulator [Pseudonocardia sp. MH-G8]|uniref:helix-turn-helix transcriptional regulator n=1 Tax=Pseudonocardia sp. MH-G8 TaxID=1854588 RepID=UPI000BA147D8|nr:AraC family transcriptional regulator [Pseudonocardia sp. MH-G8]OZM78569.1 AraC family transcriptional regulator [Pseudonocardia sp. MH-G8]
MDAVRAWAPDVPGIAEVFHARFTDHAYPEHAHDTWTLLVVDEGAIRYDLDRHEHGAVCSAVTLLPPHVAHTGRAASVQGFRKRVLYLDREVLDESLIGAAVDNPSVGDTLLRTRIHQLHQTLTAPGTGLEAESRLALIGERIRTHLRAPAAEPAPDRLAADLRDLLDARTTEGLTLREASAALHADPAHLVRRFTRAFGLPPHRYLTGRRIESARRLLLAGAPPATVAVAVGFHDQAHLHRHFTRLVGTTPGRFGRTPAPSMA